MGASKPADHYIFKTVTTGNKPGGAIAKAAMKRAAEMSSGNEKAGSLIIDNSYADDPIGSTDC